MFAPGGNTRESLLPANSSTAHFNGHLTRLEGLSTRDILYFRLGLGNPQVMLGVGVNTNVGLGDGCSG